MKHIAIFGDLHGHLRLLWKLCSHWQRHHGIKLDIILQCGDFGFFPNFALLDKATRRYAERDPEELGFANYFLPPQPLLGEDPAISSILLGESPDIKTVTAPMYWCHGNHEDFVELEKAAGGENLQTVDIYGRCHAMQQGSVVEYGDLRIGAVGGGPEANEEGEAAWKSDKHDSGESEPKWAQFSKYVSEHACEKLLANDPIPVLITHCGPRLEIGGEMEFASQRLLDLVDAIQPAYHFFSHHRQHIEPGNLGKTRYFWLEDVSFERAAKGIYPFGQVNAGCMGILRWEDVNHHDFAIVSDPWMHELRWDNFEHW